MLTSVLKTLERTEDEKYSKQDKVNIVQEKLTKKEERKIILQIEKAAKKEMIKDLLDKYIWILNWCCRIIFCFSFEKKY